MSKREILKQNPGQQRDLSLQELTRLSTWKENYDVIDLRSPTPKHQDSVKLQLPTQNSVEDEFCRTISPFTSTNQNQVKLFFNQKDQIQEDIKKLYDLYQEQISEPTVQTIEDFEFVLDWGSLNQRLKQAGMPKVQFLGRNPSFESLFNVVQELLDSQQTVSSKMKDLLYQCNQYKKQCRKAKKELKDWQQSIAIPSLDKCDELFYMVKGQDYDAKNLLDFKLMQLIETFTQKLNNNASEINEQLGTQTQQQSIQVIQRMQQVIRTIPNFEKFVEMVCEELFPDFKRVSSIKACAQWMEKVIPQIRILRAKSDQYDNLLSLIKPNIKS